LARILSHEACRRTVGGARGGRRVSRAWLRCDRRALDAEAAAAGGGARARARGARGRGWRAGGAGTDPRVGEEVFKLQAAHVRLVVEELGRVRERRAERRGRVAHAALGPAQPCLIVKRDEGTKRGGQPGAEEALGEVGERERRRLARPQQLDHCEEPVARRRRAVLAATPKPKRTLGDRSARRGRGLAARERARVSAAVEEPPNERARAKPHPHRRTGQRQRPRSGAERGRAEERRRRDRRRAGGLGRSHGARVAQPAGGELERGTEQDVRLGRAQQREPRAREQQHHRERAAGDVDAVGLGEQAALELDGL
jgi:hypothetical protein